MSDDAETAILAGGCCWIMQHLLSDRDGVLSTRAGWAGGESAHPTEEDPGGHAEAVEVVFDPGRLSYRELLEYFFQIHRPDLEARLVGSIYRSEIFFTSEEQREVAQETIRDVDAARHWPGRTVTRVTAAGPFIAAGPEDQHYFRRYPEGCPAPFPRRAAAAGGGR